MLSRYEFVVEPEYSKYRLEDYLLDKLPLFSKMYLRHTIRDGGCEVNGIHENIGRRLRAGDFVEITLDETRGRAMRPERIALDVVFEDDDLIVVNKPAGMLVHPSHRENSGTLLNAIVHHLNADASDRNSVVRPGLIHRLDKDTSGLVALAKNSRAHRILAGHFMKKRVGKRYLALVEGIVKENEGDVIAPIGRYDELNHWSVKADGKYSESRFWVIERRADTTLIEMEPITGRTNQLRIHCEAIGHPIVGDVKRGGREFSRLCLHAWKLEFSHPAGGELVRFSAEPDGGVFDVEGHGREGSVSTGGR
jgi:23S rRNA pseudouridine1911/1915/1917 synthase